MADKTFEENMTRLEEIVTRLEKGDAPLSQSLSLFEEGTRLAAACRTELDQTALRWKRNLQARNDHGFSHPICRLSGGH